MSRGWRVTCRLWSQAVRNGVCWAGGRGARGEEGTLGRQLPDTCRLAQGAQDRAAAAVAGEEWLSGAAFGPGESVLLCAVGCVSVAGSSFWCLRGVRLVSSQGNLASRFVWRIIGCQSVAATYEIVHQNSILRQEEVRV